MVQVACPLCHEPMVHQQLRGNEFWECPVCKAELWPYDESFEKQVREAMQSAPVRRKRSSTGRRKRYKPRKAGMKHVPWYQRTPL